MSRKEKRKQKWVSLFLLFVFSFTCSLMFFSEKADAVTSEDALKYCKKIASGYIHNVAISQGGEVVAWGSDYWDQCCVPSDVLSGVVAVVAGERHSLALKEDGRVIAWGTNLNGQINVPSEAQSDIIAIAAGETSSLALTRNGKVIGWGRGSDVTWMTPETQSGVVAIAAGLNFGVGIKENGRLIMWGTNINSPPAETQSDVVAIAAGYSHCLALKEDGKVIAWGGNQNGQCNVPSEAQSGIVAIAAGWYHSLALTKNGKVIAWGQNSDGQCNVPSDALSGVVAIAGGGRHSIAVKEDGRVIGWGWNGWLQCDAPAGLVVDINMPPTVAFVSCPTQFYDNENFTFTFKATDPNPLDTTLTTDIYIGTTKVQTTTSNNGETKNITIDKNKIPVGESFTLKLETKDADEATSPAVSQTITRSNRTPTVAITNYPTQVHKRENNLSFTFTVSDADKRIDPVLRTNIELEGSIVSEADFEISPVVTVSNGNIPATNGTTYQVTIRNKTKYISTDKNSFTLNIKTRDTSGATNNQAITINNYNNDPCITIAKNELSLADGKIPKHDQTFSFKITVLDSDTIDQNLNVKFYIIIDGKSTEVTTFKADSQNITNGNLIATNNQTYTITIDKTIPAENPLIPNTVNNFTLKAVVTDDLFSTGDDEIDLIHFNTLTEIEFVNLKANQEIRKSDNLLNFDLILKDEDEADTEIKGEIYIKLADSSSYQEVNQFSVDGIVNNSGVLSAQNGTKYSISIIKGVFVPMSASEFSIKVIATDTCGEKTEKEITLKHHTDIIAHWALDSVKNNIAVDSGGQNNNGVVYGAVSTTGIISNAYSFDGTNDYVVVPLFFGLSEAITTNSFSIETWVKTTDAPSENTGIVGNYRTTTTPYWLLLQCGGADAGKFEFNLCDAEGKAVSIKSAETLNDGKWHQLVGVREAGENKYSFYVDGVLVEEINAELGNINSGQNIYFGLHQNSYFEGCLDEVTLYGCALSAEEVRENYEKIVFLADLAMSNQHNDESTHPCTFGIFRNKLEFELKKAVNELVIKLGLPSSIKVQEIEAVLKKDDEGNYVSVVPMVGSPPKPDPTKVFVTKDGMITFTQPLEPGKYRIDILSTVDEHLIVKAEYFHDENKIKINCDENIFWFEFYDFDSLPNLL